MRWIWNTALAAMCLCGTATAEGLSDLPELAAREEIERQASALYRAGDFDALDARGDAYVAQGTRTSSGLWVSGLFNGGIESAIGLPKSAPPEAWDERERAIQAWIKRRPQSATAHLALANAMLARAWSIRGGGYARSVKPEAWAPFREHVARARRYLRAHAKVASRDPEYYAMLVTAGNAQGVGAKEIRKDFEAGIKRHPGYYPLYFAMLNHLMPKWHGGPTEIEAFVREAVERTRATEGEGMYARIYWFAAQNGYDDTLFLASYARWDRMRAGFEDVIVRFPDQWNLQNYAHFACEAEDVDTLKALLPRLQTPIPQAWTGRASFDACRRMAGYTQT